MLEILIVDDDQAKTAVVCGQIDRIASERPRFTISRNVHDATKSLEERQFDLLLLDLLLPAREGEGARKDGGISLLRALRRDRKLRVPGHIIGLTAYDELLEEFGREFHDGLWFLIPYDAAETDWIERISARIRHLEKMSSSRDGYDYDLAVVTALHETELEGVLALNGAWREDAPSGDDAIYHVGEFIRDGRRLRVATGAAVEMGMCAAATLSMKVIHHYRPRYLAMVGIAGGVSGNLGDILVVDQSWDYGSGKIIKIRKGQILLPAPSSLPLSQDLRYKLSWFSLRSAVLKEIQERWLGEGTEAKLSVCVGPLASGAAVVANRKIVRDIQQQHRKLIGVDMEVYGVFQAARNSLEPRPDVFAVKSVSDFAGKDKAKAKGKRFRSYAAFTSAQFLYEFALEMLEGTPAVGTTNLPG